MTEYSRYHGIKQGVMRKGQDRADNIRLSWQRVSERESSDVTKGSAYSDEAVHSFISVDFLDFT